MKSFIINMAEFNEQIKVFEKIMLDLDFQLKSKQKVIRNYNIQNEIEAVKSFIETLETLVQKSTENLNYKDMYLNSFSKPYKYIQITPQNDTTFSIVRFLGKNGAIDKRFYISDLKHNFSKTTLNIVEKIKDITSPIYNLDSIVDAINCDKPKYNWDKLVKIVFIPPPIIVSQDLVTKEQIQQLQKELKADFLTKEELEERNAKIFFEKRKVFQKSLEDTDTEECVSAKILNNNKELRRGNDCRRTINEIGNYIDRFDFSMIVNEALSSLIPPNFNFEDILKTLNLNDMLGRLEVLFPFGSDIHQQLLDIFDRAIFGNLPNLRLMQIELNDLAKNIVNLEACLPNLGIEERVVLEKALLLAEKRFSILEENYMNVKVQLFNNLRISGRQMVLFSDLNYNLIEVISTAITPAERAAQSEIREKILLEINKIIPLADLTLPFQKFLGKNLTFSNIQMPTLRPITDPFQGFSDQILELFIQTCCETILVFIEVFVNQALTPNNVDSIISSLVGTANADFAELTNSDFSLNADGLATPGFSSFASKNSNSELKQESERLGIYSQMISLFGSESREKISQIAKDFVEKNVDEINSDLNQKETIKQTIFDYSMIRQFDNFFNSWTIDSTGTKFIVNDANRTINIADLDKALSNSLEDALQYLPVCTLNGDFIYDILKGIEKIKISKDPSSTTEQGDTSDSSGTGIDKDDLAGEVEDVFNNFTAIASPGDVVNGLNGNVSDEGADVFIAICSYPPGDRGILKDIVKTKEDVNKILIKIGEVSKLDNLIKKTAILTTLNNDKLVPKNLCKPYENVDNFKKALMTKVIPKETVQEIFDNINKRKVNKYNELINMALAMTSGELPKEIQNDPRRELLKGISENILTPAIKGSEIDSGDLATKLPGTSYNPVGKPAEKNNNLDPNIQFSDIIRDEIENKKEQSPVVAGMLETTLVSFFQPIKESFDNCMLGYTRMLTATVNKPRLIPRRIEYKPEDLRQINPRKPLDKTGPTLLTKPVTVINPEFKDMVDKNMVPVVQIMGPTSSYTTNDKGEVQNTKGPLISGDSITTQSFATMVPRSILFQTQPIRPFTWLTDPKILTGDTDKAQNKDPEWWDRVAGAALGFVTLGPPGVIIGATQGTQGLLDAYISVNASMVALLGSALGSGTVDLLKGIQYSLSAVAFGGGELDYVKNANGSAEGEGIPNLLIDGSESSLFLHPKWEANLFWRDFKNFIEGIFLYPNKAVKNIFSWGWVPYLDAPILVVEKAEEVGGDIINGLKLGFSSNKLTVLIDNNKFKISIEDYAQTNQQDPTTSAETKAEIAKELGEELSTVDVPGGRDVTIVDGAGLPPGSRATDSTPSPSTTGGSRQRPAITTGVTTGLLPGSRTTGSPPSPSTTGGSRQLSINNPVATQTYLLF